MSGSLIAVLYYICFALLTGFALFIALSPQVRRLRHTQSTDLLKRQRLVFVLLLLCLILWQVTLFAEARALLTWEQLWLGRLNFAAVAVAVFLLWHFVKLVARGADAAAEADQVRWRRAPLLETALLVAITLLTPLVVESETVVDGLPTTEFGILFPLYLLHALVYLAATLALTLRPGQYTTDKRVRGQLTLIGWGVTVTGAVSLITNALLPFWLNDFRFCDVGTLSTLFFVTAIAYAVFVHRLFDLRFVLSRALVGGLLLTFVLGGYSSGVFLITQYLSGGSGETPDGSGRMSQFVVLFLAFSFDPLRRLLEDKTDEMLFGKKKSKKRKGKRFSHNQK